MDSHGGRDQVGSVAARRSDRRAAESASRSRCRDGAPCRAALGNAALRRSGPLRNDLGRRQRAGTLARALRVEGRLPLLGIFTPGSLTARIAAAAKPATAPAG